MYPYLYHYGPYRNNGHHQPPRNPYYPFIPFLAGLAVGPLLFNYGGYGGPYYGPTYGPHYGPTFGSSFGPSIGPSYGNYTSYGPPPYTEDY
ncbi:hypothetical protein SAMN05216352_10642 [Alteribacillus bidgolensis]|uniref:Penicillin-binding protein n=1 Tax=Alteribacillus bidgolensis TaxID=930129 RepID=A0A1G8J6E8_9BACI|nr:hypothetical protein SAMN05216352_10642 [Alteribacillus bidgolensis]